jgi:hypothetical protein
MAPVAHKSILAAAVVHLRAHVSASGILVAVIFLRIAWNPLASTVV